MERWALGRIWIVTSRAISERHWAEEAATSSAPPAHRAARKVRIAMTAASAWPPAESTGTRGAFRLNEAGRARFWPSGAAAAFFRRGCGEPLIRLTRRYAAGRRRARGGARR